MRSGLLLKKLFYFPKSQIKVCAKNCVALKRQNKKFDFLFPKNSLEKTNKKGKSHCCHKLTQNKKNWFGYFIV